MRAAINVLKARRWLFKTILINPAGMKASTASSFPFFFVAQRCASLFKVFPNWVYRQRERRGSSASPEAGGMWARVASVWMYTYSECVCVPVLSIQIYMCVNELEKRRINLLTRPLADSSFVYSILRRERSFGCWLKSFVATSSPRNNWLSVVISQLL